MVLVHPLHGKVYLKKDSVLFHKIMISMKIVNTKSLSQKHVCQESIFPNKIIVGDFHENNVF